MASRRTKSAAANTLNLADEIRNNACEIIQDRLYFACIKSLSKAQQRLPDCHLFTIDNVLVYEPFFMDFGPLNLGHTYRFCTMLNAKLADARLAQKPIYFCSSTDGRFRANAAALLGAYQVLYLNRSVAESMAPLRSMESRCTPFRDASMGACPWRCTVEHCVQAVHQAKHWRFIDFKTFSVTDYERFERVECGDFNVLIPDRFLAFSGPSNTNRDAEGYPALTPAFYVPLWKRFRVHTVIRLNKKHYDKRRFTAHGFQHHDLYYVDGTVPPKSILKKFLKICEDVHETRVEAEANAELFAQKLPPSVIAVHCKAGLGRTGSCISCYMMKHYQWTAEECIAWLRICRPGSVIGPQQHYLKEQEGKMWKAGASYRNKCQQAGKKPIGWRHWSKVAMSDTTMSSGEVDLPPSATASMTLTSSAATRRSNSSAEKLAITTSRNGSGSDYSSIHAANARLSPERTITSSSFSSSSSSRASGFSAVRRSVPSSQAHRPHTRSMTHSNGKTNSRSLVHGFNSMSVKPLHSSPHRARTPRTPKRSGGQARPAVVDKRTGSAVKAPPQHGQGSSLVAAKLRHSSPNRNGSLSGQKQRELGNGRSPPRRVPLSTRSLTGGQTTPRSAASGWR